MCSRPQVSASEDGAIAKDTDVVLEIPASTTIAYSVIELYVKLNGQFGECRLRLAALARRLSQRRGIPCLPLGYTFVGALLWLWGS